ncbi:MAG: YceI family protein [Ignavibacteriaceae bacterium]
METYKSYAEEVVTPQSWKIDEVHSKIRFSVKHMVIAEVEGQFNKFDFNLINEEEDFSSSQVELTIDANSIDTRNNDRDNHLRSSDFFNVENFPTIKFKSTLVKKINDEKYKMLGNLTIKDNTNPIELDVTYGGQIRDPWGNTRAGFNVKGSLNRFDYGLKWNNLIETGGAVVGKNININCDIEVVKVEK